MRFPAALNGLYGIAIDHVRTKLTIRQKNPWLLGHLECVRALLSSGLEVTGTVREEIVQVLSEIYTVGTYYMPISVLTCANDACRAQEEKGFIVLRTVYLEMEPRCKLPGCVV